MVLAALERIVTLMAEAEGVPTEFLDPITKKLMDDPVEWMTYDTFVDTALTIRKGGIYDRMSLFHELVTPKTEEGNSTPGQILIMSERVFNGYAKRTPHCQQLKSDIEQWKEQHQHTQRLWQDDSPAKANTIERIQTLLGRDLTQKEINSLQFAYHGEPVDSDWQLTDLEIKEKALSFMKDYSRTFRYKIYKECSQLLYTSQLFSNLPDLSPDHKTLAQTSMNTALADDSSLTTLTQYVCNIAALFKACALSSVQRSNIVTRWNGLTIQYFNTPPPP